MRVKGVKDGTTGERYGLTFKCPGCGDNHTVGTRTPNGWAWNGDYALPILSPSLLVATGHFRNDHVPGSPCWCTWNAEHPDNPAPFKCYRCHSFVGCNGAQPGQIVFLSDCSHENAGRTMDLAEIADDGRA